MAYRIDWQVTDMNHTTLISGQRYYSWATDKARWVDQSLVGLTQDEAIAYREDVLLEMRTPVRDITINQEVA